MRPFVDKIRVPVRLARIGVAAESGFLAVGAVSEGHEGPETVLERLNTPTRFVPFLRPGSDDVLLLVRDHIEWVDADASVDPRLVRTATWRPTGEERVLVRLAGGQSCEGVLAIEMPEQHNRASDYLNGDEVFFPLQLAGGTRLINKQRVVDVRVRSTLATSRAA